jgi:hypothetical protein
MPGAHPLRDDDVERPADCLGFGEAEDAGRAAVPEADYALGIGMDDRIGHAGDETLDKLLGFEFRLSVGSSLASRRPDGHRMILDQDRRRGR